MRVVDVKIWDNYLFHLYWKAYDFGMINFKSPPPPKQWTYDGWISHTGNDAV